MSCTAQKSHSK